MQKPQKQQQPCDYRIPDTAELSNTTMCFKKTLEVTSENAREIERETCGQRLSSAWFIARHYRLTLLLFGDVLSRRPTYHCSRQSSPSNYRSTVFYIQSHSTWI